MEGDDDELEDLDCMLTRRGVYSRAAFISLSASNCAAFIRGRRLFEGGVYSWKYGSLVPRPSTPPAFDRFQYAIMEGEGLGNLLM